LDVRILGALDARIDGQPVDLGVRKARHCFALLAVYANQPVSTARLAEGIWPEGPPPRWESALQSHVSRLRNALEPGRAPRAPSTRLETRGDAYVLHLGDDELDARRFERAAADGRAALARGEHQRASHLLGTALDEWRGPMLADIRETLELAPEVGRLEELRLVTTEEHAEAQLALGMHAAVVAELEGFVRAHPLRERAWELLLLALYRSGRQADALRRYQEVRATLVTELGIEPGPALRDLEGSILRQEVDMDDAPPKRPANAGNLVPIPLPPWLQPTGDAFVGRRAELTRLVRAPDDGRDHLRHLVVVEGEPGIGKTRLVREACGELERAGLLVLGGRCSEDPLHVLQPFAEAVGRLAAVRGDGMARAAPSDVGALASLVPELSAHNAPLPAVDADAHRYMLFRAMSALLDPDVAGARVVLVLDDLQWAPAATLQLLAHLLRDDEHGNLLVIATVRDTEPHDELQALTADLQRERRVDRIRLEGLAADDVSRLVEARGIEAHADAIFARTEGNPFYVEELVRHLDESGGALETEAVPESVRDTIARRLLRLSDQARRLLGIAAVIGQQFSLGTLALAAGVDVDEADDALAGSVRAGVVHERTGQVGAYEFSHALIQTVLREGLGAAREARVHRRIGDALAEHGGDNAEVARHLLAAARDGSDPAPGVKVAMLAAGEAVERYTYDDAIKLLHAADATLTASSASDPALACAVEIALAVALRNAGIYPERDPLLERAWQHAHDADDAELLADVIIEGCASAGYPSDAWLARIEEIRDRLPEDSRGRLMLTAVYCHVLSLRPGDTARQLAEWSLARSAAFGPIERNIVLMHVTQVLGASSPIERIVDIARGAVDAAREAGKSAEVAVALSMLRLQYLAAGDLTRSDEVARQYETLVQTVRIPRYMAGVEQRRAMRALLAGRFAEAEAHCNEAYALQPTEEYFEGLAVQLFAICYEQGRLEEIRPAVEAWAAEFERPAWTIGYASLLAEAGQLDDARAALAPILEAGLDKVVPPDDLYFLCIAVVASTLVQLGEPRYAADLYDLLAPHASRVIVTAQGALCWGSIHRFLGPLCALMSHPDRAAVHFEAAMAVHERLGARPFLARDRLAFATMIRDTGGDSARIEHLERTGLALARELGMRTLTARYSS
jgi:DNA-binding SARP family transcriptional activator